MKDLLRIHGIVLRYTGVEAPFQLGRGERQGGLFKELLYAAMEERQVIGVNQVKVLVGETCVVKNMKLNHQGFTPYQWVLGKLPIDVTSLTSEESEGKYLGVQDAIQEPEDEFGIRLQVRQAAKAAFTKVDSSRRIRAALLRKSTPLRGPYQQGDLVCFHRRGRWHGPGRIIGRDGRAAVWIVHGGIPLVAPESSLRPASASEVYAKQLLELRPSRKRAREAMRDVHQDHNPFADDYQLGSWQDDGEHQPGYVEIPSVTGPAADMEPEADDEYTPSVAPPGIAELPTVEEEPMPPEEALPAQAPFNRTGTEEPEGEHIPDTPLQRPVPHHNTPLQQAMHRSLDQLDGHAIRPPPGLHAVPQPSSTTTSRERSRSPVREAQNVRVPTEGDTSLLGIHEKHHFHCFVAKRFQNKRRKQAGAGRELNFDREPPEVQDKLTGSRLKEWNNWMQFTAVDVIPPDDVDQFKENHPDAEILPSRWVDTNKAEEGEEDKFKSRLVVRGDLEENKGVRTDSPTASQLFINLIICWAAALGAPLRAGDISAAFLQGAWITRLLAITLPKGGIPDPAVKPGSLLVARKSVYGTRDAPRGFWKALHDVLLSKGLVPVPFETAAYYLPGPSGTIRGLLGCHVDDLLWCGLEDMQNVMLAVQKEFKFGMVEDDEMKYCGRIIKQSTDGIRVTCPSVLDRTKAIYVEPQRRKQLSAQATPSEISQLRSVVGSLGWLGRICRPDICFRVNPLQAVQQRAQVRHLIEANKLLNFGMQDRDKGLFYARKAMKLEEAIIVSVTDASFGQSLEDVNGNLTGHRSQTGRILLLALVTLRPPALDWSTPWNGTATPSSGSAARPFSRRPCRFNLEARRLSTYVTCCLL